MSVLEYSSKFNKSDTRKWIHDLILKRETRKMGNILFELKKRFHSNLALITA